MFFFFYKMGIPGVLDTIRRKKNKDGYHFTRFTYIDMNNLLSVAFAV